MPERKALAEDDLRPRPAQVAELADTPGSDTQAGELLRRLRSREPREAWTGFLDLYSAVLLRVIRLFEREEDAVGDCYLFVCEQLSQNGFRKLLRFQPEGPARFSTWLGAVVRNLCLDWHRREFGRQRVFESITRMPAFDQEIFQSHFVECLPAEEACLKLQSHFPGITFDQLSEGIDRVHQALTPRQRWLLTVRRDRAMLGRVASGQDDELLRQVPSETPDPESWAALQEQRAALARALAHLSVRERLLIRLRFEQDLTLDEIARLLDLDNAQSADRRIKEAVAKLRKEMT